MRDKKDTDLFFSTEVTKKNEGHENYIRLCELREKTLCALWFCYPELVEGLPLNAYPKHANVIYLFELTFPINKNLGKFFFLFIHWLLM